MFLSYLIYGSIILRHFRNYLETFDKVSSTVKLFKFILSQNNVDKRDMFPFKNMHTKNHMQRMDLINCGLFHFPKILLGDYFQSITSNYHRSFIVLRYADLRESVRAHHTSISESGQKVQQYNSFQSL